MPTTIGTFFAKCRAIIVQVTVFEKIVDISRYTEMEIEHGHDTASVINSKQGVHLQTESINQYGENLRR